MLKFKFKLVEYHIYYLALFFKKNHVLFNILLYQIIEINSYYISLSI